MNEEYNDYENSERRCGMKEFIEKLISRLEEYKYSHLVEHNSEQCKHCEEKTYNECEGADCSLCIWDKAKEIVEQFAGEWEDGWIPCEMMLPDKYCHCLVTRRNDYEDGSFDSDVREDIWIELEGVWGWQSKFEGLIDNIVAWQPLPQPYQPKGENTNE